MKIKPVVTNRIQTRHTSFQVDLHLENNITFFRRRFWNRNVNRVFFFEGTICGR